MLLFIIIFNNFIIINAIIIFYCILIRYYLIRFNIYIYIMIRNKYKVSINNTKDANKKVLYVICIKSDNNMEKVKT